MTNPLLPLGLFGLVNVGPPRLVRRAISGGTALSGEEQRAEMTGGGSWALMAEGDLIEEAKIKAWAQLVNLVGDGVTAAVVECPVPLFQPILDPPVRRNFEWPAVAWGGIKQATCTLTGSHALRATTLNFASFNAPKPLVGGEYLSIVHTTWGERLYQVREVISQTQVKVRPPLREATSTGAVVDFDNPRCLMKATSIEMDLSHGKFAKVSASFIESRQVA